MNRITEKFSFKRYTFSTMLEGRGSILSDEAFQKLLDMKSEWSWLAQHPGLGKSSRNDAEKSLEEKTLPKDKKRVTG